MPFLSLIYTLDKEKGKGKIMTNGEGEKESAEKETAQKRIEKGRNAK